MWGLRYALVFNKGLYGDRKKVQKPGNCAAQACPNSTMGRETTQQLSKPAYWKIWKDNIIK